jgi:hypothetical protein
MSQISEPPHSPKLFPLSQQGPQRRLFRDVRLGLAGQAERAVDGQVGRGGAGRQLPQAVCEAEEAREGRQRPGHRYQGPPSPAGQEDPFFLVWQRLRSDGRHVSTAWPTT